MNCVDISINSASFTGGETSKTVFFINHGLSHDGDGTKNEAKLLGLKIRYSPILDLNSSSITYDKDDETVTLTFAQPLPVGQTAHLALDFTGELNNKMKGFYRSKYTGLDGKEQYCAVTQFEVSSSRKLCV